MYVKNLGIWATVANFFFGAPGLTLLPILVNYTF
jgi:hypothetical protein